MAKENKSNGTREVLYPVLNFGPRLKETRSILTEFERDDVANRLWHKDHTVWKSDPTEITNRLGWLDIIDKMTERLGELDKFASEVKASGFRHVVLLGMGGSSLGPEVLRQTFGSAPGYPELIVLDSTAPDWVESVAASISLRHTLFLVSSKSGTTTETLSFYRFFHCLVTQEVGAEKAGDHFVAITDAGTPLAHLAEQVGFRGVFANPEDIGGRYSVLSYFGLVPAALMGLDLKRLLESAARMQEGCAPCVDLSANAGFWLGVMLGNFALKKRDKLTLIASPSVSSFGLWVEQLLAESTGKEGKGIIPVIGEPLVSPKYYGKDRLFVYLRVKGDQNEATDKAVEKIEVSGQPVIQLEIGDQYDLGAEFFRWEMATAVAGAVLKINPFDQPDVQSSKDATKVVLKEFESSHHLISIDSPVDSATWLSQAGPGKYLGLMVHFKPTPSVERALARLRQKVTEKYGIATTLGYGPRFLHSTGQLHKGGPNTGFLVQIKADRRDLYIPGEPFSFGVLTEAESQGDYRALKSKRRKIIRLQLDSASGAAVDRLTREMLGE